MLISPCIETSDPFQTSYWTDLGSFTPGQSVQNKIESDGYKMQFIQDANYPLINLDFFFMPIQQMPKKSNGQRMTNEELINYFRLNINNYSNVGPYGASFSPISSDNTLWNSSNPLGSIINIDIPGTDNGAVVCSDYSSCCWIFSTIKNLGLFYSIGPHPVSGNRQFGIAENGGNKYFYIKGVDRAKNWLAYIFGYSGGEALWNTTIDTFEDFIKNPTQDGQCTIGTPTIQRPSWNKIKEQLMSNQPINHIACE